MSTVIVAEKPSVARDIAGVVGADQKRDGCLASRDESTVVTWAFGHLVRYAEPNDYGPRWAGTWDFGRLPMIPDDWLLTVPKEAQKQFEIVKRLLNSAERVICATDAGREGEHIFRLIYKKAGCQAPVDRLWVSSLTHEALKVELANLHPGRRFDALAQAAEARAKADWLVGMNLTRAYSVRHGTTLSIGRVQTPGVAPFPWTVDSLAFKPPVDCSSRSSGVTGSQGQSDDGVDCTSLRCIRRSPCGPQPGYGIRAGR